MIKVYLSWNSAHQINNHQNFIVSFIIIVIIISFIIFGFVIRSFELYYFILCLVNCYYKEDYCFIIKV